jgi:6-methylsalicylate decarboxylase
MAQREPGETSGGRLSSGRIDVHAHYVPAGLQASVPAAPLFRGFATWHPEAALEVMDRQGIAGAILSMVLWTAMFAAPGDSAAIRRVARCSNEAAAEAIRSHPGRFGGFARLPLPDVDAALAEIDYSLETLRLDGVVLLTNHDGVYPGDGRLDPIFDELNRRQAVVFLHPTLAACVEHTSLGYAPSLLEFVFDTTRAVTHLALSGTLERCPDLQLIVPHAGGTIPFLVDRISLLADRFVPGTQMRAPAGVKAYFRRLYYELAISTNPHAVASVLQLVGPERLLYGSDWPALDEADVHNLIELLGSNPLLQPDDRARIERRNALKLFPRLQP